MDLFKRESDKYYGYDTFGGMRKSDKRCKRGNIGNHITRRRIKRLTELETFYEGFQEFVEQNKRSIK